MTPERKMPAGMRIAHKRGPKSTRKKGEFVNGHTLVEPLGDPSQGPPLYWRWRCKSCDSEDLTIETQHINNLKKVEKCRHCGHGRQSAKALFNAP